MPLNTCFGNFYAPATDATITCANLNETLNSIQNMADDICNNPVQVYFDNHASVTLTIPAADLPTGNPERIAVYVNGTREYDTALSVNGSYTVNSSSEIELTYDPTTSNILVEYLLYD